MTDVATVLREGLAGRYRIDREIGRGGMATVYLAQDPRHDRNVAVKVLDPDLGAVLGAERFLAEIKVTANLQHPNLLPLFDSGAVDGLLYYVMPFIDGESLRVRLDREKQLPINEAVQIATGVAKALAYAHAQGVIHRDLKPENILLQSGQPLVADFGIALAVSNAGGTRITQTGLSLGTPQYMSPEQATGDRTIDARSDIYALGAVLYEMLTGEPPHTGVTVQAVIAKVLTDRPRSIRLSRPGVPVHVEAAVECALEKLPADRFTTAGRFAEALEGRGSVVNSGTASLRSAHATAGRDWKRLTLAAVPWALLAGAVGLLATRGGSATSAPAADVIRATIPYEGLAAIGGLSLTPDGHHVVFTASVAGKQQIYVRSLSALATRALAGTVGASSPFVSPDSRWIGFFVGSRLKKIALAGGIVEDIAEVAPGGFLDGTWASQSEMIVASEGLKRVSASGGSLRPILNDKGNAQRGIWPLATPDGNHVFYVVGGPAGVEDDYLHVTSLRTGATHSTTIASREPVAFLLGHVLFRRDDGALMAARFDERASRIVGDPVQVLEPGRQFAVASNGTAAYIAADDMRRLMLRAGDSSRALWSPPWPVGSPRISPDGRLIAVNRREPNTREIWVYDLTTSTPTRIAASGHSPEWSPDGRYVIYQVQPLAGMHPTRSLLRRRVDASEPEDTVFTDARANMLGSVMAPDGSYLIWSAMSPTGILRLARRGDSSATRFDGGAQPKISPDGKWLAFTSTESGQPEVYVRSLGSATVRVTVSAGGGGEPVWERTGRAVYYRQGDEFVRAALETQPTLRVVRRDVVLKGDFPANLYVASYDAAPDGQRLLVMESASGGGRLVLVLNFIEEMRRKIAN